MSEVAIREKHYHDGGGVVGREVLFDTPTVAVCSCGKFVKYVFRGEYPLCGWYWVRLNPWDRWRWRKELRAHRTVTA